MIKIEDLHKSFGKLEVLKGISTQIIGGGSSGHHRSIGVW